MVELDATRAFRATRDGYDAAAAVYAERFRDSLRDRPLDRAILGVFAEAVGAAGADGEGGSGAGPGREPGAEPGPGAEPASEGGRLVADVGCGPGHVTAHLHGLGVGAFGVDASPAMIGLARQAYPGLRFEVGTMEALAVPDGSLAGVVARWSVIHTPPAGVPPVLAEFHRVLAPGGHLLIGFSATDGPGHLTQVFDHTVAPAHRWWPDHLAALLRDAGLTETARLIREPEPEDRRQFKEVQLLARKGAGPTGGPS
ncbi:Methyltransferase domain-containing protein [Actinacidiphila alni]|uniref:Methyltransferase domain-containing protein n=1 Tax=Actinacidiphila alni TaxID=380248 RepID=A0A1I1ZD90_9ACTN|nr:class I SAM-dependent methyltransferase [Actinacidiphila alni]SFE29706.1 Methyltransferase domain-containing protein [Actinacidiphila alni]